MGQYRVVGRIDTPTHLSHLSHFC